MLDTAARIKLHEILKRTPEVIALYLFGSSAAGRNRRGSDIDLAIMTTSNFDAMDRIRLETLLSNVLGKDVDLVVFSQASPLLQHQILKHGILLYERNRAERVRREVLARSKYFDTQRLHKKIFEV